MATATILRGAAHVYRTLLQHLLTSLGEVIGIISIPAAHDEALGILEMVLHSIHRILVGRAAKGAAELHLHSKADIKAQTRNLSLFLNGGIGGEGIGHQRIIQRRNRIKIILDSHVGPVVPIIHRTLRLRRILEILAYLRQSRSNTSRRGHRVIDNRAVHVIIRSPRTALVPCGFQEYMIRFGAFELMIGKHRPTLAVREGLLGIAILHGANHRVMLRQNILELGGDVVDINHVVVGKSHNRVHHGSGRNDNPTLAGSGEKIHGGDSKHLIVPLTGQRELVGGDSRKFAVVLQIVGSGILGEVDRNVLCLGHRKGQHYKSSQK